MIRYIPLTLALLLCLAAFQTVEATFTIVPTADITPTVSPANARNVAYTFHVEDHDPAEVPKTISITIPAGYTVNPDYITDIPGIDMGRIEFFIDLEDPWPDVNLILHVRTTNTQGVFGVYLDEAFDYDGIIHIDPGKLGEGILDPPTTTTDGKLTSTFESGVIDLMKLPKDFGIFVYQAADLILLPGVLINPPTAGRYTWSGTVTGAEPGSEPQEVEPRPGYTLTVRIIAPVGGTIIASNVVNLLTPVVSMGLAVLALAVLAVVAIRTVSTEKRKR